jgi:hypothetical protein
MAEEEVEEEEDINLEDRENQSIDWDEAVERGRELRYYIEQSQLKLGKLASKVQTAYGDENLKEFADRININYETLKRYRSTYRAYEGSNWIPTSYSVARALARIPEPEREQLFDKIDEENGTVTEVAALQAAKEYRERRSAGKYEDLPIHKLVSRACRIINAVADEDSELEKILNDIGKYESIDFEYAHKVVDSINRAIERLDRIRELFNKK